MKTNLTSAALWCGCLALAGCLPGGGSGGGSGDSVFGADDGRGPSGDEGGTDVSAAGGMSGAPTDGDNEVSSTANAPKYVTTPIGTLTGLVVDERAVYTLGLGGELQYQPTSNGLTEGSIMEGDTKDYLSLKVDGSSLYWVASDFKTTVVQGVHKEGGSPFTLMSTEFGFFSRAALALDADSVWALGIDSASSLVRIAKAGGAPTVVATGLSANSTLAVDDHKVYWGDEAGDVMSIPKAGGAPVTLAPAGTGQVADLEIDDGFVYWAEQEGGRIRRVAKSGGTVTDLATRQGTPLDLAVDAKNVYWVDLGDEYGTNGSVVYVPKAGGTPTVLVDGVSCPYRIAIDDKNVYWATGDQSVGDDDVDVTFAPDADEVFSLPKP